jgi:hypothetical protein
MLTVITGDRRLAVEYQGVSMAFTLAPESLTTQLQSLEWARQHGLWQNAQDNGNSNDGGLISAIAFERIELLRRIKAWEGVAGPEGKELPCTDELKVLVFGQHPGLIALILDQLRPAEEAERKNSEPSQDG